jgi:hypothetical protein
VAAGSNGPATAGVSAPTCWGAPISRPAAARPSEVDARAPGRVCRRSARTRRSAGRAPWRRWIHSDDRAATRAAGYPCRPVLMAVAVPRRRPRLRALLPLRATGRRDQRHRRHRRPAGPPLLARLTRRRVGWHWWVIAFRFVDPLDGPIGEEPGWRACAMPRLRRRWSRLRARRARRALAPPARRGRPPRSLRRPGHLRDHP